MSTDHQRYSIAHQELALTAYAAANNLQVLRSYVDSGRSGLGIKNRPALNRLLDDVQHANCPFGVLLIYDISRWGRFQDVDEGAYYEHLCHRNNIKVIYCQEPFVNDGGSLGMLVKSIKRLMAAEYSRELSDKVWRAQRDLAARGLHQGGPANFGLRRALLGSDGTVKTVLQQGQQKSLQGERVILVPGPKQELALIRSIYRSFVTRGLNERQIMDELISRGVPPPSKTGWRVHQIRAILSNSRYIGRLIYNQTSGKLLTPNRLNPEKDWVVFEDAFSPIVPKKQFEAAGNILRARRCALSDDEMLKRLRELAQTLGPLRARDINSRNGMPKSWVYGRRFGSLLKAYVLAGVSGSRNFDYVRINHSAAHARGDIVQDIVTAIEASGSQVRGHMGHNKIFVDREWSFSVTAVRCYKLRSGHFRWRVQFNLLNESDIYVVACMGYHSHNVETYFLLPRQRVLRGHQIRLGDQNDAETERHRLLELSALVHRAKAIIAENEGVSLGLVCQRPIGHQPVDPKNVAFRKTMA
jgi:DNA invertase Pin-like site-specific DNA recombinase